MQMTPTRERISKRVPEVVFPRYAGRVHREATIVGDNRRGTVVVLENAPKSLSRYDEASVLRACRQRGDELVAETLVVSLCRSQNTDAKLLIYQLFSRGPSFGTGRGLGWAVFSLLNDVTDDPKG